jgi:signal transduction histidine kinase
VVGGTAGGHLAGELVTLFEHVDGVVVRIDIETEDVVLLGEVSGRRLGLPSDVRIERDRFWSFVPAPYRPELAELVRGVAGGKGCSVLEHPAVLVHRGAVWFRTCLMRTTEGSALLGVMLDITEARHQATLAREVESWLVTLGETMPFDFWICDREGHCVLQNPISRMRIGDRRGSASPDWDRSFSAALRGEPSRDELEDGHRIRFVSPVRGEEGIHAVLGVEIDVTELKHTEEQLRRSLAELREAQESLVRKKQLAALGEMSATIAHEIRNPLAAMSNAIALLRKRERQNHDAHDLFDIVRDELKRLERLVANLLDSVRPMHATLVPASLPAVADTAWARVERESMMNDVRLHRTVAHRLPLVPLDHVLLDLALTNVFRNAVQAMPSGGDLFMTIGVAGEPSGTRARLTVRDSGIGLPSDLRDRVFEPFFTTRPTGSGLGLAIVKRIVEEHHGHVVLSSEPGRGTTCSIELPVAPGEATL